MVTIQQALRLASKSLFTLCCMLSLTACGSKDDSDIPGKEDPKDKPTEQEVVVDNTKAIGDRNRVIYEMNVGSFTSAGTFAAAGEQLAELHKLGIDIVWLMPIYPRGGGIDSPYAATDFKQTNPKYGTVADLKAFVAKAHGLGMEVWLDWVPNHTATNAKWVTSNPEYYTKKNGQMVHPNNYGDVFELNYQNEGLVNAMNDCLKFWIDEADIDGYRCDYISSPTIPISYWQKTIPMLKSYKAGKEIEMLGESDFTDPNNARLKDSGFEYDYAWWFQESVLRKQMGPNGTDASALQTQAAKFVDQNKELLSKNNVRRMVYLTNHDQNYNDGGATLADMYGGNRYAFTVLQFTIMGMPLLYNGQEISGMQKLDYFKDAKINWSNVDKKMQNTIRTLVALRHTQKALADDVVPKFLTTQTKGALAYSKTSGSNTVVVVMNLDNAQQNIQLQGIEAGDYTQWIDSNEIGQKIYTKKVNLSSTATVTLGAKGYAVFVK